MCYCCCCPQSSKQTLVFLIISVWIQLLCGLASVTKMAFFTEKGVDDRSYVYFSIYLCFGAAIWFYTIIWGIYTISKHNPVKTNILTLVSIICTAVSIGILTLIKRNIKVVQHDDNAGLLFGECLLEVLDHRHGFITATFFMFLTVILFIILFILLAYLLSESLFVSGYKLIAILWIFYISAVFLCAEWSLLYLGMMMCTKLLVGSLVGVQVAATVGLCFFICRKMQSDTSKTMDLGQVIEAFVWCAFTMHSIFYVVGVFHYIFEEKVDMRSEIMPITYIIISTLFAYLIILLDLRGKNDREGNLTSSITDCENGNESATAATMLEDCSKVGTLQYWNIMDENVKRDTLSNPCATQSSCL